jgi:small subunit ribosomal protein S17
MTENPSATSSRRRRQTLVGTVVSDKMERTVVVAVESTIVHELYHRRLKRTSKFYAHDEGNACRIGDRVRIVASRPLSRLKRWRVAEVLARAEE